MQIENNQLASTHQNIEFDDETNFVNPYANSKASLLPKLKHLTKDK
jgi:hypothetical protein